MDDGNDEITERLLRLVQDEHLQVYYITMLH